MFNRKKHVFAVRFSIDHVSFQGVYTKLRFPFTAQFMKVFLGDGNDEVLNNPKISRIDNVLITTLEVQKHLKHRIRQVTLSGGISPMG